MPDDIKKENSRSVDAPQMEMRAVVNPTSVNEEARTVQIEYTTGERVYRSPWFGEPYYEELSLEPGHMRLERMKEGRAPILDSHASYNLRNVLGAVVDADERLCTAKMSRKPESDGVWMDIKDGIYRNVSVGYRVHKYEDVTQEDDDIRVLRAIDWEPIEVSLVPIGADSGAGVRSDAKTNPCVIVGTRKLNETEKGKEMPDNTKKNAPQKADKRSEEEVTNTPAVEVETEIETPETATPVNEEEVRTIAIAQERQRSSDISDLVRSVGLDDKFADNLIKKGQTIEQARAAVIEKMAEKDEKDNTRSGFKMGQDDREARRDAITSALMHRANPSKNKLVEGAEAFRGMSLIDIARELIGYQDSRGLDKHEIARRSFMSTSDFPNIMANVASKTLRDAYEDTKRTFTLFSRQISLPDFKEMKRVALSNAPSLKQVYEGGEYQTGSFSENAETIQLLTFGRIVRITREAIINDDLDAFTRIPMKMGAAAARLENRMAYDVFTQNPQMSDGENLFSVAHKNLTDKNLGVAGIGECRRLMRVQTDPSGEDILNYEPKFLIVPAALETEAYQLKAQITPNATSQANPFSNTYEIITEGYLDNASAVNYYMAADPSQADTLEYGYLDGQVGPYLETREGFDTDGIEMKVRHDFIVKAIEHRGLVKSTNNES